MREPGPRKIKIMPKWMMSVVALVVVGSSVLAFQNCGQITAKQSSLISSSTASSTSSELSSLRQAEAQLNSQTSLSSVSPVNPDQAICVVRGGAGVFLSRVDFASQTNCQSSCDSFAASHPNRICTWKNVNFFGDPKQACTITGGAHAAISSTAQVTFSECQTSCAGAAVQHPYRMCDWGTDRFFQPSASSECRVIGGAGKMLLNPSIFGTLADCLSTCASFQTNVYRQCYYGANPIQVPTSDQRCDIWGGAGKVLTPSFYGSLSDCQASCTSFTSNPNRICFYGKTRVQQ